MRKDSYFHGEKESVSFGGWWSLCNLLMMGASPGGEQKTLCPRPCVSAGVRVTALTFKIFWAPDFNSAEGDLGAE